MKNILIVPGTTMIAKEIHDSLICTKGINLFGAGYEMPKDIGFAVDYAGYGRIPELGNELCFSRMLEIVKEFSIDMIFLAHDEWIYKFKDVDQFGGSTICKHPAETIEVASFKSKTYDKLRSAGITPFVYDSIREDMNFPIAIKPDRGQGSKGFKRIDSYSQAEVQLVDNIAINKLVITEYLPGKEYTVDCFTDSKGQLLFTSSRIRTVIVNGIASKTEIVHDPTLLEMAELINRSLKFCGAWFFQVKIDNKGSYKILEIGCRIAGASGLQRSIGVNLSELWVHLMDGKELMIAKNLLKAHRTVSKENSVVLNHAFDQIFVDFDDCLIFKNEINTNLLNFLKRGKREGIELFLITRHEGNIFEKLEDLGIRSMFSDIYHLVNGGLKSQYFSKNRSILFVDDSFRERLDASKYQNVQSIDPSVFIDYVTLKSENHEGY